MQKGGEGVQIACKIAYVLNGRPLMFLLTLFKIIRRRYSLINEVNVTGKWMVLILVKGSE